ncbi:MAG: hypothetical protein AAB110_07070, partial [Candidatus Desantisbacteria bacterium]
KLPSWFLVKTPLGGYNPDWAIVTVKINADGKESSEKVYFVIETKGTTDADDRRITENQKKDWHPLLFIMTDGIPSDLQSYREAIPEIKKHKFGNIVACAAGPKAKQEYLKELTDNIVCLDTLDSSGFLQFFKFVSDIMAVGSRSADAILQHTLPSPPAEVRLTM